MNKKIVIGIDGNEANYDIKVGVSQYATELLKSIYRIKKEWQDKADIVIYLKDKPSVNLPIENNNWRYKVLPGKGAWILKKLTPEIIFKRKTDVLFSPSHYLPPIVNHPLVCTIHDLGYLKFSEQFTKYDFWQLKLWSAISIFLARSVIAVSNSTADDIVRHYSHAARKIAVVHHGYDKERFNTDIKPDVVRRVKEKYAISKNYILFLGTLKPSKNIEGLLDGFAEVLKNKRDIMLVISGKKGWFYESIFNKVNKLKISENVIFTDYLPEEDKPGLLSGATMFVLPSFWEGFGIPVVEAMACGTPVVVSSVASLPEVAGDAGVYIDPEKSLSIANGIKKILNMNKQSYDDLVKKCVKQSSLFDWDDTARKTIDIIMNSALR